MPIIDVIWFRVLKILMLLDFLIFGYRLFHYFTVERKKEFLKKSCFVRSWGIFSGFREKYLVFGEGTSWKRYLHLHEHKFKNSFQDCLNPLCLCGNEIETSTHYLLHCPTYTNERLTLLNKIKSINCSILESSDAAVTKILLFGDNTLSNSSNTFILNSTIEYIISTQRFEGSILTPV